MKAAKTLPELQKWSELAWQGRQGKVSIVQKKDFQKKDFQSLLRCIPPLLTRQSMGKVLLTEGGVMDQPCQGQGGECAFGSTFDVKNLAPNNNPPPLPGHFEVQLNPGVYHWRGQAGKKTDKNRYSRTLFF